MPLTTADEDSHDLNKEESLMYDSAQRCQPELGHQLACLAEAIQAQRNILQQPC